MGKEEKYIYSENDIQITDSLCEACIYHLEGVSQCRKFEKRPDGVVMGKSKCPEMRLSDFEWTF